MKLDGAQFSKELSEQLKQTVIPTDVVRRLADFIVEHPEHASIAALVWHGALISTHHDLLPMFLYMAHEIIQRATRSSHQRSIALEAAKSALSKNEDVLKRQHWTNQVLELSQAAQLSLKLLDEFYPMVLSGLRHVVKLQDIRQVTLAKQFVAVWCELNLFAPFARMGLEDAVGLKVTKEDKVANGANMSFSSSGNNCSESSSSNIAFPTNSMQQTRQHQHQQLYQQQHQKLLLKQHQHQQQKSCQVSSLHISQNEPKISSLSSELSSDMMNDVGGANNPSLSASLIKQGAAHPTQVNGSCRRMCEVKAKAGLPNQSDATLSSLLVSSSRAGIYSPSISPYLTCKNTTDDLAADDAHPTTSSLPSSTSQNQHASNHILSKSSASQSPQIQQKSSAVATAVSACALTTSSSSTTSSSHSSSFSSTPLSCSVPSKTPPSCNAMNLGEVKLPPSLFASKVNQGKSSGNEALPSSTMESKYVKHPVMKHPVNGLSLSEKINSKDDGSNFGSSSILPPSCPVTVLQSMYLSRKDVENIKRSCSANHDDSPDRTSHETTSTDDATDQERVAQLSTISSSSNSTPISSASSMSSVAIDSDTPAADMINGTPIPEPRSQQQPQRQISNSLRCDQETDESNELSSFGVVEAASSSLLVAHSPSKQVSSAIMATPAKQLLTSGTVSKDDIVGLCNTEPSLSAVGRIGYNMQNGIISAKSKGCEVMDQTSTCDCQTGACQQSQSSEANSGNILLDVHLKAGSPPQNVLQQSTSGFMSSENNLYSNQGTLIFYPNSQIELGKESMTKCTNAPAIHMHTSEEYARGLACCESDLHRSMANFGLNVGGEDLDAEVESQYLLLLLAKMFPQASIRALTVHREGTSGFHGNPSTPNLGSLPFVTPQSRKGPRSHRGSHVTTPNSVQTPLKPSSQPPMEEAVDVSNSSSFIPPSLIQNAGRQQQQNNFRLVNGGMHANFSESIGVLTPTDIENADVLACSITPVVSPRRVSSLHSLEETDLIPSSVDNESALPASNESARALDLSIQVEESDSPQLSPNTIAGGKSATDNSMDASCTSSSNNGGGGRRRKRLHELVVLERIPEVFRAHATPPVHDVFSMCGGFHDELLDCKNKDNSLQTIHKDDSVDTVAECNAFDGRKRTRPKGPPNQLEQPGKIDNELRHPFANVKRVKHDLRDETNPQNDAYSANGQNHLQVQTSHRQTIVLSELVQGQSEADVRLKKCLDEYLKIRSLSGFADHFPPSSVAMGAPRTLAELEDDEEIVLLSKLAASRDQCLDERRAVRESVMALAEVIVNNELQMKSPLIKPNPGLQEAVEVETTKLLNVCQTIDNSIRRRRSLVAQLESRIATENRYLAQLDTKRRICMSQLKAIYREQLDRFGPYHHGDDPHSQASSTHQSPKLLHRRSYLSVTAGAATSAVSTRATTPIPTAILPRAEAEFAQCVSDKICTSECTTEAFEGTASSTNKEEKEATRSRTGQNQEGQGCTTKTPATPLSPARVPDQQALPHQAALSRRTYVRLVQMLRVGSNPIYYSNNRNQQQPTPGSFSISMKSQAQSPL